MKIRNTKDVSVNDVQCYLTTGAFVLPELYYAFLCELAEMEHKRKLCLLPQTRLQLYSQDVERRILAILAA